MSNFWDFSAWGFFNLTAVLLLSLLAGNMLKRSIPFLQASPGDLQMAFTLFQLTFTMGPTRLLHISPWSGSSVPIFALA